MIELMTTEDLQQIGKLIDTRLDAKLDEKLGPLKSDLSSVKNDIVSMKGDISSMQGDISTMKGDISSLKATQQEHTKRLRGLKMVLTRVRKDVHYIAGDYDQRIIENKRSIERLEHNLGLPHKN